MKRHNYCLALILLLSASTFASVDGARIESADDQPGNWLTHGRTYSEQRLSLLTQINEQNVNQLGLDWYFDTGTTRGLEASPLVFDGMLYTTGSWSKVFALDARTGELKWSFDPEVPRAWGANACCDVVNRGVAAWGDQIFVGTIDGRLIALDSETGEVNWDVVTIDTDRPYTITGAPRVVNGKVIIGNGGAEYGVRGYLSGYDVQSGELAWRFFTVPGNPSEPYESDALKMAAETWTGDLYWQVGGGGTVWDSMAYDPELNLLYFGVGNGSPWNRHIRSPGGGDNLFLSSIVAINPDNGEYAWHYQTTPGDTWDYTATQHIILADIEFGGTSRKVLMQAPKNGFFYVLDRTTGELLSAEKYTTINWASHVDMATGRPVETENADHYGKSQTTRPAPSGGHNWQPMAFNAKTGLVYIPAMESTYTYNTSKGFTYLKGPHWNLGQSESQEAVAMTTSISPALLAAIVKRAMKGKVLAWDPTTQKEVWRVEHPTMWNGGVLSTASNLVFQGTGDGRLVAYAADTGETLWQANTQTGVIAPPVTYDVDGTQYIALMAGWGGVGGLTLSLPESASAGNGRLLVYKLDGTQVLPALPPKPGMSEPPPRRGTDETINAGANLYNNHCWRCHGAVLISDDLVKDLREISKGSHDAFQQIVRGGILLDVGMISFAEVLTEEEVESIHDYVVHGAHLKWEEEQAPEWWQTIRNAIYEVLGRVMAAVQ
ncbi:MAG: quinohemoprotein ethanol dehydrogenase [Candidatus Azotimanducaceae bacterium]|jgi:quinohemoprotein ethanol dehydrogenase